MSSTPPRGMDLQDPCHGSIGALLVAPPKNQMISCLVHLPANIRASSHCVGGTKVFEVSMMERQRSGENGGIIDDDRREVGRCKEG